MEWSNVDWSRMLTAMTLGFHIIFATIGVGIPVMICLAEWIGIKKGDSHYILMARRWARGFTITVAVGVVTGTCIGLQLSLLWPSFMRIAGQVISLPLFMETFAFFFEAIFLGIYLYTWDRFKKPIYHWLLSLPVVIGSSASAFFITTVNAFMNTPQGFKLKEGALVEIEPIIAMLNPATPSKTFHVLTSSYLSAAFILAGIAAFAILRGRGGDYQRKALKLTLTAGFVFALGTAIAGDVSAKFLSKYQPEKLAALEWHFETEPGADLLLFGKIDENNEITNAIKIPGMLSFLAGNSFGHEVTGLNEFPEEVRPPLWIHYLFDSMVGIGVFALMISGTYTIIGKRRSSIRNSKLLLMMIISGGPLSMLAVELGWILAEVGRQPWILRGYMKVSEGATTAAGVRMTFMLFLGLYLLLGTITVAVLGKMFKNKPPHVELGERYGK
ncbi:cytochrome ubiquinol oxidase subunit I [Bacillus massilinigeriensis]|uniref:cytochrome ubiquinol oxidase subunit I n=1 Tax=Bacillus mediterraneensis TaxID=1805474 RepID=UPI0008F8E69A|nr:cytochrome ubiquinol oxidase subunit I [Bacillus mediterraneensis]